MKKSLWNLFLRIKGQQLKGFWNLLIGKRQSSKSSQRMLFVYSYKKRTTWWPINTWERHSGRAFQIPRKVICRGKHVSMGGRASSTHLPVVETGALGSHWQEAEDGDAGTHTLSSNYLSGNLLNSGTNKNTYAAKLFVLERKWIVQLLSCRRP